MQCILASFVKDKVSICVWIYLWAFYFVPLIYMSVFVPVPFKCGYWHLWRYNPALEAEGKNPFSLDSKEPNWEGFKDFLKGEVRYASVMKQYPAEAEELFQAAEDNAKWRYNSYKRMEKQWSND